MDNPVLNWLGDAFRELLEQRAPVTYTFIGIVIGVFIFEMAHTHLRGLGSIHVFAIGLFGVAPLIAWPLAPVLHKGSLHFLASVMGLWLLGVPVEQHWGRWRYVAFLVGSGYLATAIGVAFIAPFTAKDIAFYGSSGVIFALAGFSLVYFLRAEGDRSASEWFAVFVGAVSLVHVAVDPFLGPYFAADWVNGGHLGGFVVGVVVGWWKPKYRRSSTRLE